MVLTTELLKAIEEMMDVDRAKAEADREEMLAENGRHERNDGTLIRRK
jgi:hypothetical protein